MLIRRTPPPKRPVHVAVVTDTQTPGHVTLRMEGCWRKDNTLPPASNIAIPQDAAHLAFDCDKITEWDSGLLAFLDNIVTVAARKGLDIHFDGLPEGPRRLLRLARAVPQKETDIRHETGNWFHHVGQKAILCIKIMLDINRFVGELTISLLKFCVGMSRARWSNIWDQISKAGYQSLPLISMIGFLIGLILAFIGSIPLKMFGADIFVASLVGIGVLRLMSPVMVGTVMAGRTGASFAAELGSMNVNDEIDAFQAMGVSPMEFLVLPRFIALIVMIPLLCLYSDLLGILGGMTVGLFYSNLTYLEFYRQMTTTTTINDLLVGLATSFVFGVLISICGCYQGIKCGRNSTAVGQAATSAVVASIICMTLASAIITVLTVILKI